MHDTFPHLRRTFGWQEGYGVFSISVSGVERTISYIDGQKEHHRRRTFEEEYQEFLDAHMIEYKDEYVFG